MVSHISVEAFIFCPCVLVRYEFLISKETVVLRRWERSKQKFGFIKQVDKGWITTVKNLESWRFERQPLVRANSKIDHEDE